MALYKCCIIIIISDCPGVGGRKYDVECGVFRLGPILSDGVISHTGENGRMYKDAIGWWG